MEELMGTIKLFAGSFPPIKKSSTTYSSSNSIILITATERIPSCGSFNKKL